MALVPWLALVGACLVAHPVMAAAAADPSMASSAPAAGRAADKPMREPKEAVQSVFSSHEYRFCHEPLYPLTSAEKTWCDLGAADDAKACPALKAVCRNDAGAKQLELPEPIAFHLPDLGLPVRLLLWLLLGLAVALLVFALVRHFLNHEGKADVVETAAAEDPEAAKAAALARQVETDVQRLLERARTAAMAGDFRSAIGDAYAALLRRLEGAGVVRIEPDQTNGDYVRRVKGAAPALAGGMAGVVEAVEDAQFGNAPVTRESFDDVFGRVSGLLTQRLGVWVLLGLALLGASCGHARDDWDHSPSGRAAIIDYLGKRGFQVHERLLALAKISESATEQLVLLPGAQVGDDDWHALARWMREAGHTLVLAGGHRVLPDWIGMKIVEKKADHAEPLVLSDADAKRWGRLRLRVPENHGVEVTAAKPVRPTEPILLRKQGTYAMVRWLALGDGDGDEDVNAIVVLGDDFLFRNVSLLVEDNAVLLDHLLRDGGTNIELAGDLTGLVSSNPIQSVQRGRLGPTLLQLAGFLLLFFLCKGARFGKPVATEASERREFSEHVRALGLHYARARADRLALGFVGAYVTERLRERFRLRADHSLSGLAEAVAGGTGRPVGEVMRLLIEARDASKGEPAEKDARDLETASELCRLLEATGGSGGHTSIQSHV